jgi:hypothetical protein
MATARRWSGRRGRTTLGRELAAAAGDPHETVFFRLKRK